jgi:tetratricopeptide (TPR) repeat protein
VRQARHAFGPFSATIAELENESGILCKAAGRFDEAERHYARALTALRRVRRTPRLELADLYHNLAGLAHARGAFADGEPLARRGIQLRTRRHGPEAPIVWLDRTAHAALLDGLGRQRESIPVYRTALRIFRRAFGPTGYDVAVTLNNLGCAEAELGRFDVAAGHLRDALRIKRALMGTAQAETGLTLYNLATVEEDAGRLASARRLKRQAGIILRRRLGSRHPVTVACRLEA